MWSNWIKPLSTCPVLYDVHAQAHRAISLLKMDTYSAMLLIRRLQSYLDILDSYLCDSFGDGKRQ